MQTEEPGQATERMTRQVGLPQGTRLWAGVYGSQTVSQDSESGSEIQLCKLNQHGENHCFIYRMAVIPIALFVGSATSLEETWERERRLRVGSWTLGFGTGIRI